MSVKSSSEESVRPGLEEYKDLAPSYPSLVLVLEWAQEHRAELMEDWELCKRNQSPKKISPLL